jgi:glycosyltransferase involved in cell wall biosynthesis
MEILLNGLSIVYPISGVGQYTLQLAKGLEDLLGTGSIFWFGKKVTQESSALSDNRNSLVADQIRYTLKNQLRKLPGLTTGLYSWRNSRFKSHVRQLKPSLYHETKYVPFHFDDGPTLVTIYDLSFVRHPEWHPADRVKYFERYCLKKLPQVDAIITISEFSKKEIIDLLGLPPDKITVTLLGVDNAFRPGKQTVPGLPERYILSLGNLEPRKNLPLLVNAYASLPGDLQERYPLVIAGAKAWHHHELNKTLSSLERKGKIILTGYIPQGVLPNLHKNASLFVYPSLYEGFGLPVLEAMASGVPVITSNTTSLPEVVGDAGLLVDPQNVDALREGISRLLADDTLRRDISGKGLERARLFSWEKCCRETLAVYERVIGATGKA